MDSLRKAEVISGVVRKFRTGEKIDPAEFKDFVRAQNDGAATGLNVGERVPDFALPDQSGSERRFSDLSGPAGLVLVFSRSADW